MAITKFLDPKNDYAFKRIFGTEKNKDILIHFLFRYFCPMHFITKGKDSNRDY